MEVIDIKADTVLKNGWIFSPRYDFLYFYLPFLLGGGLLLYSMSGQLDNLVVWDRSSIVLLFAMATFLDSGHILSTITQEYFDPQERAKHKRILIYAPIAILIINLLIYWFLGMQYFQYFFAYFNFFHIMKQQYGWMAISYRKSGFYNKFEFTIDKVCIYLAMLIPFLWIHFTPDLNGRKNLSPILSNFSGVADVCKYLFLILAAFIFVKQTVFYFLFRSLNFNKLFIISSTLLAWGAIMFIRSPMTVFITMIMHSVPYLALIYFHGKGKEKSTQNKKLLFAHRYSFIIFPVFIIVCGYLFTRLLRFVGDYSKGSPGAFFEILSICFSVAFFMHYYLDSIIWKRRNFKPESLGQKF